MAEETTEGAEATAGTAGAEGGEGQPEGHDRGDYDARITSEPDFALEQVKAKDRRITELTKVSGRVSKIDPLLDQVGGQDGLLSLAQTGAAVQQNPHLQEYVNEVLRTGQVPTPAESGQEGGEEDPYEDPAIKEMRTKLRESEERFEHLSQRLDSTETRGFRGSIERNLIEHINSLPDVGDLREKAKNSIVERIEAAEAASQRGDPLGRSTLESLGGPTGMETLRLITAPLWIENTIAIARHMEAAEAAPVEAHSTGARTSTNTTGGDLAKVDTRNIPVAVLARQTLERETRKQGRDPLKVW